MLLDNAFQTSKIVLIYVKVANVSRFTNMLIIRAAVVEQSKTP